MAAAGREASSRRRTRLPRVLAHYPLHDAGADAQGPADLEDAIALGTQLANAGFDRRLDRTSAKLLAVCPGARKARPPRRPRK